MSLLLGPAFELGSKLIDKLFSSPEEKAKAQLELMKMQKDGELEEMKTQLSVILSDSQSADKWTSRARPSFLYVVYLLILSAIPMGIVYAIHPATAANITLGFKEWLSAIPQPLVDLFTIVMMGYIGGRSLEKIKGAAK